MVSLFLGVFFTSQVPVEQPPRLRTILPNGAVVLVERIPQARQLSAQLFVSARSTADSPTTHGLRHLLEHLVAKGAKADLDQRLESKGAFLSAQTYRDAMNFSVSAPAGEIKLAVGALSEMMRLRSITPDAIARESQVIDQEAALLDGTGKLTNCAWQAAYGNEGLSPLGDLAKIRAATPDLISQLHNAMFRGPNLVLVIAGDVDLDGATAEARKVLGVAPPGNIPMNQAGSGLRPAGVPKDVTCDASGESRSAIVGSFRDPSATAALAAALAIASEVPDCFVSYTPTVQPGLVTLGRSGESSGLSEAIDVAEPSSLFARGKLLARQWVRAQLSSPAAIATLRGLLIVQDPGARPDSFTLNLDSMTLEQFKRGLNLFKRGEGVSVNGR